VTILAVTTAGVFVGWSVTVRHNLDSHLNAQAAQLARAEIERAKLNGANGLPFGAYSASSGTAAWSGAYDATANAGTGGWVANLPVYYDASGTRVASAANASLVLMDTLTDSGVLATQGSGYALQPTSQRGIVVTVTLTSDGSTVLAMGTTLVQGGL